MAVLYVGLWQHRVLCFLVPLTLGEQRCMQSPTELGLHPWWPICRPQGSRLEAKEGPPSEVILVGAEPKDSAIRNPIYNSRVITMRNINSLGLLSQNCKAKQTKPNVTCRELQLRLFWIPSFG